MKSNMVIMGGLMLGLVILSSCNSRPDFKTPVEAIEGCRHQLEVLKGKQQVSIEELTDLTSGWMEIQDSAYSVFARDSSLTLKSPIALSYFMTSDSIKKEITRLALDGQRSLSDVMYIKLNAVRNREKIQASDTYKEAESFFRDLDNNGTYPGLDEALPKYFKILKLAGNIRNEKQLLSFIAEEDKCFRSIMANLCYIPTPKLQQLTEMTGKALDGLYYIVGKGHNEVNDRTMLYLTMRFNRRIILNAETCQDDVNRNKKLNNDQKANYRWMLVQPYISIDDYSTSVLTTEQKDKLMELSKALPKLLEKLGAERESNNGANNLTDVLATYFMKSFLTTSL